MSLVSSWIQNFTGQALSLALQLKKWLPWPLGQFGLDSIVYFQVFYFQLRIWRLLCLKFGVFTFYFCLGKNILSHSLSFLFCSSLILLLWASMGVDGRVFSMSTCFCCLCYFNFCCDILSAGNVCLTFMSLSCDWFCLGRNE